MPERRDRARKGLLVRGARRREDPGVSHKSKPH